jgi:lysozyme
MKISDNGIEQLIKSFEGLKLEPYLCPAKILTIGYGHVILTDESFSKITQEYAVELLKKDLHKFDNAVTSLIKVPVSQSQFDAMVSLCFNIGVEAFKNSTLLKKLNSYDNK